MTPLTVIDEEIYLPISIIIQENPFYIPTYKFHLHIVILHYINHKGSSWVIKIR